MSYPINQRFICGICNYIEEGPNIEANTHELPAGYICPSCGAAREAFAGCQCESYPLFEKSKTLSLDEIVSNIQSIHHGYLRNQFPIVAREIDKVTALHGDRYAHLAELKQTFDRLEEETLKHINHEDGEVFYGLLDVARTESSVTTKGERLEDYLNEHRAEHKKLGDYFARIKVLTNNYKAPANACPNHRAMLFSLQNLEKELGLYINKENYLMERLNEENNSVLAKC